MKTFNKLNSLVLFLFGLFPILPSKLKGLPVFFLVLIAIYSFRIRKTKKFDVKFFLLLSSLFIINIISLLNTMSFPIKNIETSISLVLIPLIFSFMNISFSKKALLTFIKPFIYSSTFLAISHLTYFFLLGLFNETSLKVNSFRKAVLEIPLLNDHPIYVSLFLSVALIFIINYGKKKEYFLFLSSLIIIFDLFLISSKGVLIALLVAILINLCFFVKTLKVKLISVSVVLGFFIISFFYFPTLERRFRELKIRSTYVKIDPNNSSSIRYGIYKCVFETIKEKPVFGYGFGSSPQLECYQKKSEHLFLLKYNSHNQYLGYFLNAGFFGVITLLFFVVYLFRFSYRYKDYLFFSLILFFSIVMLTENILERQSGVILFTFIINLFFYFNLNKPQKIKNS